MLCTFTMPVSNIHVFFPMSSFIHFERASMDPNFDSYAAIFLVCT
uniref:Uncharacterized protein n=1 Tax=Arundo donax TaxID=35708 RepID=A0A0A9BYM1_ARUDO